MTDKGVIKRTCKSCGERKVLNTSNFRFKGEKPLGYTCRSCLWEQEKQRRHSNVRAVQEIKVESGCVVCGYNKSPYALQFNHINPEMKTSIRSNPRKAYHPRWSMSRILKELSTCEVLCANCHAEKTHEAGNLDV